MCGLTLMGHYLRPPGQTMRFQHLPFNYDLIEDGVHKANEIDFAIIIIHLMTTKLTAKNSKFLWLKWKA